MFITYRRTGGIFALLTFAAIAFAATVLTIVVAATLLIVALGTAAAVLFARAVLPASWRHHTMPRPTPRPGDTIEATVVHHNDSSDERDLLRMDSNKG
jgi:hypothetical protein